MARFLVGRYAYPPVHFLPRPEMNIFNLFVFLPRIQIKDDTSASYCVRVHNSYHCFMYSDMNTELQVMYSDCCHGLNSRVLKIWLELVFKIPMFYIFGFFSSVKGGHLFCSVKEVNLHIMMTGVSKDFPQ
jgi:hypothetical protein